MENFEEQHEFNDPEEDIQISMCLLEDDIQCGHIFFSDLTRVLKFYCTYCQKVTDNINYFCEHLSLHVNDNEVAQNESNYANMSEDNDACANTQNSKLYNEMRQSLVPSDLAGFDESKMVVEELDEAEEIAAEVEEEMRQELESEHMYSKDDNSCSNDFFGYEESPSVETTELPDVNSSLKIDENKTTDYEKLIDGAGELPSIKTNGKKKKKVTTVKVIALKNRVAELYERIKFEEERRSRKSDETAGEEDLTSSETIDENISTEDSSTLNTENEPPPEMNTAPVQKIIGETVITLLPTTHVKEQLSKFPGNSTQLITINASKREDDKTTCPACGRKFRNVFSLTIHKRTHYLESSNNVKLAHKCSDCDQLFNKITDLKEHIHEVHYPDGFICKICNKKLSSLTLLETHMRKVHLSRPFSCDICHKNFENRDRFDEHVKAHSTGQPYRCNICGRKYSTECILKQHMRRHKEQVPQCCVVCGKMTLRITQHMKIHAPRPKRVLSCKVCGKVFNFSSGLSHHFKIMHKLPRPPTRTARGRPGAIKQPNSNSISQDELNNADIDQQKDAEDITKKEEEAKRVIVELIQNSTYTSFFPEDFPHTIDSGPPIAREETISAVNSIVNE